MISPEQEPKLTYSLKAVALIALGLGLLYVAVEFLKLLGEGGVVILAAILVAYLIMPLVDRLRHRMSLVWALSITYVLIVLVLALTVLWVVPPLATQAHSLIVSLPGLLQTMQTKLSDPTNPLIAKAPPELRSYIMSIPAEVNTLVAKYGLGMAQRALGVLFSVASLFLSVIIVPILAAYLFFDTAEVKRGFLGFIPENSRPKTLAILSDVNHVIGAFVRGQVLDGVILAIMVTVMLWLLHVPYALLIGVAAGFLNLVPYLGAIIGFIPSVTLALAYNGWENALLVALLFAVIQQIDGNFILPRIMKENVLLSPLIIIVSILIFSALFGVMGTFLAVPIAAILRVLKLHFLPAPGDAAVVAEEKAAQALRVF